MRRLAIQCAAFAALSAQIFQTLVVFGKIHVAALAGVHEVVEAQQLPALEGGVRQGPVVALSGRALARLDDDEGGAGLGEVDAVLAVVDVDAGDHRVTLGSS